MSPRLVGDRVHRIEPWDCSASVRLPPDNGARRQSAVLLQGASVELGEHDLHAPSSTSRQPTQGATPALFRRVVNPGPEGCRPPKWRPRKRRRTQRPSGSIRQTLVSSELKHGLRSLERQKSLPTVSDPTISHRVRTGLERASQFGCRTVPALARPLRTLAVRRAARRSTRESPPPKIVGHVPDKPGVVREHRRWYRLARSRPDAGQHRQRGRQPLRPAEQERLQAGGWPRPRRPASGSARASSGPAGRRAQQGFVVPMTRACSAAAKNFSRSLSLDPRWPESTAWAWSSKRRSVSLGSGERCSAGSARLLAVRRLRSVCLGSESFENQPVRRRRVPGFCTLPQGVACLIQGVAIRGGKRREAVAIRRGALGRRGPPGGARAAGPAGTRAACLQARLIRNRAP